jgi:hypothetical protein
MKFFFLICLIALPVLAFSQQKKSENPSKSSMPFKHVETFEEYCLKHATSILEPGKSSKSIKITGEISKIKHRKIPTYAECGIQLKENETQYFSINGSDQLLAVKSLYVLRLNYTNSKK